jgi:CubicO group peptidase (beta-lactamase class C family)
MRWRRRLLSALLALLVLGAMGYGVLAASTSRSQLARAVLWGESDMDDHRRFPARPVAAGPDRFQFRQPAAVPPAAVRRISVRDGDRLVERDLEQFLAASGTTAFLIARGDRLLYEGYFNGADHNATQTSMSVAKSVLGALVGVAVGEGRIGSVEDPITRYVPELADRDRRFGRITLRHLLTMPSGLRYQEGGPWGDDTATYDAPDLRALALEETEVVEAPGRRFLYNNFNPLLVAQEGRFRGRQPLPRAWLTDPTRVPTRVAEAPARSYQFFWWVQDERRPRAQFARGKYGQHLYVVPDLDLVLVRLGRDVGYQYWPQLLSEMARRLDSSASSGSARR